MKFSTVELKDPAIHLTRYADGHWSISGLLSREQSERSAAEMAETTTSVVSWALYDRPGLKVEIGSQYQPGGEYDRYLLEVYRNGEFKRPRNIIGILAVQTPEVMTRMLKANIEATPGEIRLLALQRGEAVASLLRTHEPVEIEEGAPRVELRFQ
ncbi:MAG: hypothetical protein PF442_02605 [Desulfobulbaceae bacterium]|nr:hypothetical protein [Desulfobulbaceae bacterium]